MAETPRNRPAGPGDGGGCRSDAVTVAINDFVSTGGDGYPNFYFQGRVATFDYLDVATSNYIAANTPISPSIQGRIQCTSSSTTVVCPAITAP